MGRAGAERTGRGGAGEVYYTCPLIVARVEDRRLGAVLMDPGGLVNKVACLYATTRHYKVILDCLLSRAGLAKLAERTATLRTHANAS